MAICCGRIVVHSVGNVRKIPRVSGRSEKVNITVIVVLDYALHRGNPDDENATKEKKT